MQLYKVYFHDEFRLIRSGWRRVRVEIDGDKVAIQTKKGAPKVHTSRTQFFAMDPIKIFEQES